jgi:hypothetical protein
VQAQLSDFSFIELVKTQSDGHKKQQIYEQVVAPIEKHCFLCLVLWKRQTQMIQSKLPTLILLSEILDSVSRTASSARKTCDR